MDLLLFLAAVAFAAACIIAVIGKSYAVALIGFGLAVEVVARSGLVK